MTDELWKDCLRHPEYEVSSLGRVRRRPGPRARTARVLKPYPSGRGYLYVDLGGRGPLARRGQPVHQLVAECFHGPRPAGHDVDHVDWNRHHNAAANLRYLRTVENRVRWKDRTPDGRNVWATPDDDLEPEAGHEPLTAAEAEAIAVELAGAGWTDTDDALAVLAAGGLTPEGAPRHA